MNKFSKVMLGSVVLTSSVLAGCGAKTEETAKTEDGKTVVTVWAWDKNFNIPIMEEAAKRYEAEHKDVDIQVVDYAKADVETKLKTGLQSKAVKTLPDITLIEDYNGQSYLTSYKGMFADLTDKVNASDFAAYKIKAFTVEDKLYGLPFDSGVSGMFYRKDYFEKAGIKPEQLQNITWDGLIEAGKKMAKANPGVALMADNRNENSALVRQGMQSASMWYFDESDTATIETNPAALEMLQNFKDMNDAGIWKQTNGWEEWVAAANKGEVAVYTTGAWFMPSIMAGADQSGKWGIAPFPRLDDTQSVNASNLGGSSWSVVDKNNEATDIAIDFLLKTFGSDVDFYQTILKNQGAIGTYLPAQNGEAYQEAKEFFGGQQVYQDFSKWMQQVPEIDYGANTTTVDEMLHAVMPELYNGTSPADLLKEVSKQVESQIK